MDALPRFIQIDQLVLSGTSVPGGGQATKLVECIAPDGGAYLFKSYTPDVRASVALKPLDAMVAWRLDLSDADRAELDVRCAWPRALVMEGEAVQGVLIRPAPDTMTDVIVHKGTSRPRPRHLSALARPAAQADKLGLRYYEAPVKLAVLARFCGTMLWLHERGYAVGDLQPLNAMFSYEAHTADVMLIDCDACAPLTGRPALLPQDPEIWKTPTPEPFGVRTDLYKFAWMVVRCLQENLECPAPDPDRLRSLMQTRTLDTLVGLCAGHDVPGAGLLLRDKASAWPAMVTPNALYVQTDESMRRLWLPEGAVPPAPAQPWAQDLGGGADLTSTARPRRAPSPAPAPSGEGVPARLVVAVLVVLLIAAVLAFLNR
ncbi:hypothetical protein [Actinomadura rubrisoli]|uniref:Protein kinase domain-containing protein n=1 Tax=Actinomadura rubrisoli TaxID=2530368 RepID=A0A4R5C4M3_9ACTN|nr:hypothetical protein [Actinomadura rubrisoli]TDD94651.1 hypothetical protein E1298_06620 [Actinomadura rubrisoli]